MPWLADEAGRDVFVERLALPDLAATWRWLREGIDYDDYPFSASEYYSRLRFVSARMHEAAGEIEPAPGLYREVATARTLFREDDSRAAAKRAAERLANR